jgi:hypothetical protein
VVYVTQYAESRLSLIAIARVTIVGNIKLI